MKPSVFTRALVSRLREERCWRVCRLAAGALATSLMIATPAMADNTGYEGYEEYYPVPQRRVPRAYETDPVNRRSSLTPEPVWRSMFPSIDERAAVEERTFGVPTETQYERRYWQWWHRRATGK